MDGQAWGAGLHRLGRRVGLRPLGWVHGAEEEVSQGWLNRPRLPCR